MDNINPNDEDLKRIEKLFKNSKNSKTHIRRQAKKKTLNEKKRFSTAIHSRMNEMCDAYLLFCFDTNGEPHVIINAESNLEQRGLSDLLMEYINPIRTQMMLGEANDEIDDEDEDDYE